MTAMRTRLPFSVLFVAAVLLAAAAVHLRATSPRFFTDDPIATDPETQDASRVQPWDLNDQYDFVENTFFKPQDKTAVRAVNINTIDEVPDSSWFTNRIGQETVSIDEIVRGPLRPDGGPADGPWTIIAGKSEGITPGLTIRDSRGIVYFVKFDPPRNPEMASAAEAITTRFFHALGYHVPENYIAVLQPERLQIDPKARLRGPDGNMHAFQPDDIEDLLKRAAKREDGGYRVVASKGLSGKPLGPFRYWGTRPDDPNDIFPHEHRRELRGLRVPAAWLNHDDSRAINTGDFLIDRNGQAIVWHYLIDFGSTLGSGSTQAQKPRAGNEYIWEARPTFVTMLTLGFYVRPWLKVDYPEMPSVGRIEADFFQPERWKPEYPNPAFDNLRADDAFWAARRVLAFSDEAVRAVVGTGEYTNPAAAQYVSDVLIKRRNKVADLWLNSVLPIVDLALNGSGTLSFRNVAIDSGLAAGPANYRIRWFRFDNATGESTPAGDELQTSDVSATAPPDALESDYVLVEIRGDHPTYSGWSTPLRAYFHRRDGGWKLVGLNRQPE
jgi:hypothetical protein